MDITEVRVKLADTRSGKLKAFATVTFDNCFVVREIKVISGTKGLFVAMPSRKLNTRCRRCGAKNHIGARYCNECAVKLSQKTQALDDRGRAKLYADIAHPINQACRSLLQKAIVEAYHEEVERSRRTGYRPAPDDTPEDAGPDETEVAEGELEPGGGELADAGPEYTGDDKDAGGGGGEPRETPAEDKVAEEAPEEPPGRRGDSSLEPSEEGRGEPREKRGEERHKDAADDEGTAGDLGIFG